MTTQPEFTSQGRPDWPLPAIFWVILIAGVALRLVAFNAFSAHHPDETIQYLEQAHRLVFGQGVVPWEYRYDIRSWLIPLALAGPMALGEWLAPGGTLYLTLPRGLVALVNLSPIVAAWFLGARCSRQHAIVAMAVAALWVECVLFSVQTLSESMAVACFLPAAVLLRRGARLRSIALAGLLMALAGLLRFQFAPAIAIFALLVAGRDARLWKGLLIGGIPVVLGGAAIDLAMGLAPFEWIANNYAMNIGAGRMRAIGGVSHSTYAVDLLRYWSFAAPPILLAAAMAGRNHRPLLIAAVVNILVHQLIGHKEWRYLWLSAHILLVLAAVGSVNLARLTWAGRRIERPEAGRVSAALVALWGGASLMLALSPAYSHWRDEGSGSRLAGIAGRNAGVCGLAVPAYRYPEFGHAFVHRPIPLYALGTERPPTISDPGASSAGFNAIIAETSRPRPPAFTKRIACGGSGDRRACLYLRPGNCAPNAASEQRRMQAVLEAIDM